MADTRVHLVVYGHVQGVGFRWFTVRSARKCSIRGTVRNLPDGDVEVDAEGDELILHRFIELLRGGPPGARVDGIDIDWNQQIKGYTDFVTG
jgi:acylphosphatase